MEYKLGGPDVKSGGHGISNGPLPRRHVCSDKSFSEGEGHFLTFCYFGHSVKVEVDFNLEMSLSLKELECRNTEIKYFVGVREAFTTFIRFLSF